MATIKVFDLHSAGYDSENCIHHLAGEFLEAVSNSVIRSLDARQLQEIRGGFELNTTMGYIPEDIVGAGYGNDVFA